VSLGQLLHSVTSRFVSTERADSVSSRLRERRWERFLREFPDVAEMRVLDIGGEAQFWRNTTRRPAHITMVNVVPQEIEEPWMNAVVGDGCALPADLGEFELVFSNSVIEHVGGHWRRERFAEQVRSAAPRYWVQTPNRYFPIEPHYLCPFFQHLPRPAQASVAVHWPLGNDSAVHDRETALRNALEIELLSRTEMQRYFPDAELLAEKVVGLTKSWIAVRHA
jgi:hypothetical protein